MSAVATVLLAGGLGEIGAVIGPALLVAAGCITVLLLAARLLKRRSRRCPCCTSRPMESGDCTCREDCGVSWCQAADPEEPMFYEGGHVIGRDGREAVLRRAREEDRLEAEADAMAAEYRKQQGDGRG